MATIETYPGTRAVVDAIMTDIKGDLTELNNEIAALAVGGVSFTYSAKTANYTVLTADLIGTTILSNTGAAGTVIMSLPAGAATYRISFYVGAAQILRIKANGAETIRFEGVQTAGGGYIQAAVVGHYCTIEWNSTEWIVTDMRGGSWYADSTQIGHPILAATTTVSAHVELATVAENETGTDTARASTPAGVKAAVETFAKVVQRVGTSTATTTEAAGTIPLDDTIPQNDEGHEVLTQAITPTDAANTLEIEAQIHVGHDNGSSDDVVVALFQDSTANALYAVDSYIAPAKMEVITLKYSMTTLVPDVETTFKIRIGAVTGNATINGYNATRVFGGVAVSSLTVKEIR